MSTWRTSVVNASDRIFPGLAHHDRKKEFYDIGNQIQSSLPLQMALYFNVWVYPLWFLVTLVNLDAKYYYLTDVYKFVTIAVFIVLSVSEGVRLYLGYLGNLAEKVANLDKGADKFCHRRALQMTKDLPQIPELASFWLISTLIHFPLEMFLLLDSKTRSHLSETIVNGIMMFLLVAQIVTATVALKRSANHHAKRFYMAQLYGIDETK